MLPKFISFLVLLLLSSGASAQFVPSAAASRPAAVDPAFIMPAGKIYVDLKTMRAKRVAANAPRVEISCVGPTSGCPESLFPRPPNGEVGGAFRIGCTFSHVGFADPIVYPGRPGMTHLHVFFGNTSTDSYSDVENMATVGNSTCAGGTINRTGYWVPPMIYHCPAGSTDGCDRSRDGEIQYPSANEAYYKSDCCYNSTGNNAIVMSMQWPPAGLRMIAGSATSTAVLTTHRYDCEPGPGANYDHIPTTAEVNANTASRGDGVNACQTLWHLIYFPQCWDGVNLDSPNHQSHMKFADAFLGCNDSAYPVLFPTISYNIIYPIKSPADLDHLRLSSDQPKLTAAGACATLSHNWCAGATLHGDWLNGWATALTPIPGTPRTFGITDAVLQNCLRPETGVSTTRGYGFDCHVDNIGPIDPVTPNTYYWLQ